MAQPCRRWLAGKMCRRIPTEPEVPRRARVPFLEFANETHVVINILTTASDAMFKQAKRGRKRACGLGSGSRARGPYHSCRVRQVRGRRYARSPWVEGRGAGAINQKLPPRKAPACTGGRPLIDWDQVQDYRDRFKFDRNARIASVMREGGLETNDLDKTHKKMCGD
jgi:hypothetical protein